MSFPCKRESSIRFKAVSRFRENRVWIPAFAGMTKRVLLQRFNFGKILLNLFCAFFILTICGCQENAPTRPVATVDGVKISISEFNERLTREMNVSMDKSPLTPAEYDRLKEEVLNALINEKVMLLRAGELSLSISDAELMKKIEEIKESYLLDDGFERVLAAQRVNYGIRRRG